MRTGRSGKSSRMSPRVNEAASHPLISGDFQLEIVDFV